MAICIQNPQDCLTQSFSHMKHPRNPSVSSNRQKKPNPNQKRRSPPPNKTRRSPSPVAVPKGSVKKNSSKWKAAPFYAGPVTMTSPSPTDVPVPSFFSTKKCLPSFQPDDVTNDFIKILRLDLA